MFINIRPSVRPSTSCFRADKPTARDSWKRNNNCLGPWKESWERPWGKNKSCEFTSPDTQAPIPPQWPQPQSHGTIGCWFRPTVEGSSLKVRKLSTNGPVLFLPSRFSTHTKIYGGVDSVTLREQENQSMKAMEWGKESAGVTLSAECRRCLRNNMAAFSSRQKWLPVPKGQTLAIFSDGGLSSLLSCWKFLTQLITYVWI